MPLAASSEQASPPKLACQPKPDRDREIALLAPLVAAVVVLAIAFSLDWYARPLTDDLYFPSRARDLGVWGGLHAYWTTWGGRWISFLGNAALPRVIGLHAAYSEMLVACQAFWIVAMATLFRRSAGLAWPMSLAAAATVAAVVWERAVTAGVGGDFFYWAVGARENLVGVSLPTLGVALLVGPARGRLATAAGVTLLTLAPGVHELYGLFGVVAAFVALAVLLLRRDLRPASVTPWALAAGLGLTHLILVTLGAPGNAIRAATMTHAGQLPVALRLTVGQGADWLRRWVFDLPTVALAVLAYGLPGKRPAWCGWKLGRWSAAALLAILGLSVVGGAIAAHAWETGEYMAGRTQDALQVVTLLVAVVSAYAAGGRGLPDPVRVAAAALLVASMLVEPGLIRGATALRRDAPRWAAAMDRHHARLSAAAGRGEAVVLPPTPSVFWDRTLLNDPAHYRNAHTRLYYDVPAVRMEPERR